jgi:signal transduction histidine kinase
MNPGPVCRLTRSGVVKLANAAATRFFGRRTIVGQSWIELSPSLTEAAWRQVIDQAASHQYEEMLGEHTFVFTVVHREGSTHVYVYGTDVTSLKAAERALEDHAATLADLARFPDMNPGPVFRVDLHGTVLLANRAARRVWGDEDLTGRSLLALCRVDPEDWARTLAGAGAAHHDVDVGGRCLTFTFAHEPGTRTAFVYGTDVTDLKLAEQQLAEQTAELREMARFPEMNPGPVCSRHRAARVILANRSARELFDDPKLVGKCWMDLCPGMDAVRWEAILTAKDLMAHEARVNGRELIFAHTPGADGRLVFVYGADVTEQKTAERAMRQSDKLATLGTLAAGVAHELNNPAAAAQRAAKQMSDALAALQREQLRLNRLQLTDEQLRLLADLDTRAKDQAACGCNLDALTLSDREAEIEQWLDAKDVKDSWEMAPPLANMEYSPDDLDGLAATFGPTVVDSLLGWLSRGYTAYSLLEEIRLGSGRVSEIVSALKAYSYVGQAPIQAVDLNQGVRNTLIVLRSKLKQGISVEQDFGDVPRIQAYGSELNQVWTNLIDNAIQAMGGAGRMRIRTAREDDNVLVEIEDDGPGIPAEIQPRIFDPFFTTKAPGEGTGLGLHTCYDIIVKKHGGTIDVVSKPGSTLFAIGLPLQAVASVP